MGLRTIGRWLYHTITSAEKRPYIKSSLESLELLTAEAADNRDVLLLFDVLDELKYRKTIPSKRDALTRKIISLIKEFGTHSGVGTGKNRTRPLNHQLGDVKLQGLSMSWRRRLISCWAIVRASLLHGDGHSRPAPESPIDRGPVAGCWCKP